MHGLSKEVFSRTFFFKPWEAWRGRGEPCCTQCGCHCWSPHPQSASIVPMGEVTDIPTKICPNRICQGRQDKYEAAHTWEPKWDQKQQELVMKARWSEVRSWDSWGCPRHEVGNQKRARTWGAPACAQPWPDHTSSSHRLVNGGGEECSQIRSMDSLGLQLTWGSRDPKCLLEKCMTCSRGGKPSTHPHTSQDKGCWDVARGCGPAPPHGLGRLRGPLSPHCTTHWEHWSRGRSGGHRQPSSLPENQHSPKTKQAGTRPSVGHTALVMSPELCYQLLSRYRHCCWSPQTCEGWEEPSQLCAAPGSSSPRKDYAYPKSPKKRRWINWLFSVRKFLVKVCSKKGC